MGNKEVVKLEYGNIAEVAINGKSIDKFFVSDSGYHCVTLKVVELGGKDIYEIKIVIWTNEKENNIQG